jgi:hypothetical protein
MKGATLISLIFIFFQSIAGQELAFESMPLDANIYDLTRSFQVVQKLVHYGLYTALQPSMQNAFFNKKTSQYDIFINETKVASANSLDTLQYKNLFPQLFSQTVFNSNTDWEILWLYIDSEQSTYNHIILTSSDGTIIWKSLPDERSSQLVFDDTYSYIRVAFPVGTGFSMRYYRFHPALPPENFGLSKKAAISTGPLQPLFSFNSAGDCTLKLHRSSGGATTVSLLNLLGQQIFSKTIPDLDKEVTINLPSGTIIPQTVITKVQNSNGASFAKTVPVK